MPNEIRHLDMRCSRVRGVRAEYLLVLQHEIAGGRTRIVAPVLPHSGSRNVLLPEVSVAGVLHQVVLMGLVSVPMAAVGERVGSAVDAWDDIQRALAVLLTGDPAWAPG